MGTLVIITSVKMPDILHILKKPHKTYKIVGENIFVVCQGHFSLV